MPALTGQCKRCSRFGELYPVRGVYYCRACGETYEKHLRGYHGPERRHEGGEPVEAVRRRWSDVPGGLPGSDWLLAHRPIG